MRRFVHLHGLSVTMFGAFLIALVLQSYFGWHTHNNELTQSGAAPQAYLRYLRSGHFLEAVFENWEAEFLSVGGYVLLTGYLVQKGSPESKPETETDRPGDDERLAAPDSPRPVKVRGVALLLYRNSLSIALLLIFAGSLVGHLVTGAEDYNTRQALQSNPRPITAWQFLGTDEYWFQSMQNWQGEFLAVGALIVLGIVLRQRRSPKSKPVTAPHMKSGDG
jgi:hypothetical protein